MPFNKFKHLLFKSANWKLKKKNNNIDTKNSTRTVSKNIFHFYSEITIIKKFNIFVSDNFGPENQFFSLFHYL